MKRIAYPTLAIGLGLLAIACCHEEATPLLRCGADLVSGWSTASQAYAAPPSRGIVARVNAPRYQPSYDAEPIAAGVVVSDRGQLRRVAAEAPVSNRLPAVSAGEMTDLDQYETSLPDDEPEQLVAEEAQSSRRTSAANEPFVSRRRGTYAASAQPQAEAAGLEPAPSLPTSATAAQRTSPQRTMPSQARYGTPTLAEPEYEQEPTPARGARSYEQEMPLLDDSRIEPAPDPRYEREQQSNVAQPQSHSLERELPATSFEPAEKPQRQPAARHLSDTPNLSQPSHSATSVANSNSSSDSSPFDRPTPAGSAEPTRGVMLRWETPSEIQVDTETECRLLVENTTDGELSQVVVDAQLPAGLRLAKTEPSTVGSAKLAWNFATLAAHEQKTIRIWVIPTGEGEVEPTATVTFSHATAAKLQVIHPQLQLEAIGPTSAQAGQPTGLKLLVSNPGSGKARQVVVEVQLDARLQHSGGEPLRYNIGTLAGGESREVQVTLNPTEAGQFTVQAAARGEPGLAQEARYDLEVVKPTLQLAVEGPKLRYVDRQATYLIKVHNPGPSPADNVQLFDDVPAGFRFVDASSGGTFDSEARQVAWFVGRIEPNQTTEVQVQLIATEPGEQRIAAAVKADAGVSETAEAITRVEGVASIALDVIDADDPIEVAGETCYEIRLTNRGSQPARQVQAAAKLPPELEGIEATGPTAGKIQGLQVVFEPLDSLEPGQTEVFRVRVNCRRAGQVTFKAYYRDADHPNPVVEEEVTRVYEDE